MPAALTEVDTREVSLVDRGAVKRRFAMRKRDGASMKDVVQKALSVPLEPELLAKLDAELKKLQGDAGAVDPNLKNALKGILQMFVMFKDKLSPELMGAMAHLVGFSGAQMAALAGDDNAPAGDTSTPPSDDPPPPTDDTPATPDNETPPPPPDGDPNANKDPTGKEEAPPDGQTPPDPNDPENKKPPFGKRGTVDPAFEAFKKAANAENEKLRKAQDELRKQNEAIRADLRKREISEMVRKNYPNLGANEAITQMCFDMDQKGLLKSMEPKLAAWNNQMQASELFKEAGANGGGQDLTPAQQLDVAAKEIQKADPKLSYAKAYDLACSQNPVLRKNIHKKSLQG